MLNIAVVSIFPEMFDALKNFGVISRAFDKKMAQIHFFNPRDYTDNKHGRVDDRPFGGGPGMLMQAQPLYDAIEAAKQLLGQETKVIYLSPKGECFTQELAKKYSNQLEKVILLAGRYEGIDERVIELCVDEELSIGDYVLSGGELPAMVFLDAVLRLRTDVLGNSNSAEEDSFSNGLLDCPHYTQPRCFKGLDVPQVLLSGNHQAIEKWRLQASINMTLQTRKDLIEKLALSKQNDLKDLV